MTGLLLSITPLY